MKIIRLGDSKSKKKVLLHLDLSLTRNRCFYKHAKSFNKLFVLLILLNILCFFFKSAFDK